MPDVSAIRAQFAGKSDADIAAIANRLFFSVRRTHRTTYEDNLAQIAHRGLLNNEVVTYQWGDSGPRILLMHGWNGRGTQLSGFVQPLLDKGCTVLAIDAPGHGDSPGERSNGIKFAKSIMEFAEKSGSFDSIIAHSLGGTAALAAMHRGMPLRKAVLMAPASFLRALNGFASAMEFSAEATRLFIEQAVRDVEVQPEETELFKMAPKISAELLLFHDRSDAEVDYACSAELAENYSRSQLVSPTGVGHRRIVRSPEIIQRAIDFVTAPLLIDAK